MDHRRKILASAIGGFPQGSLAFAGLTILIAVSWNVAAATSARSPSSLIAFVKAGPKGGDIYVVRADGTGLRRVTRSGGDDPAWAPDRRRIAFDGTTGVDVVMSDGTQLRRVNSSGVSEPGWSPDGRRIVVVHYRGYHNRLKGLDVMNADGSGLHTLVRVIGNGQDEYNPAPVWSPDGKTIAFSVETAGGGAGLAVVKADGRGEHRITNRQYHDREFDKDPTWSPDGRRIAFGRAITDGTSYASDIAVVNVNGGGLRVLTKDGVSGDPSWSPDGTQIAYDHEAQPYGIYFMSAEGHFQSSLSTKTPSGEPAWR